MLSADTRNQTTSERLRSIKSKLDKNNLLVHEIYASVQGESSYMGFPCVFVRTTGCHLRCSYCDTEHAFFEGQEMAIKDIISQVKTFGIKTVELTGGEPLLQRASFILLDELIKENFIVLLETSGAVSIANVNRNVRVILDIKTPSSKESGRNVYSNLELLWPSCEVKFVIGSHEDYLFAKSVCDQYKLYDRSHVLFSPVVSLLDAKDLAQWMVNDALAARFQLQLHRVLYGEMRGK